MIMQGAKNLQIVCSCPKNVWYIQ